ncbi:MAG: flagellar biosynthetic protein FliR [Exilibacterium sp.]
MDTGVAMVSRTMPQINIYFVSLPLKIFLGLWLISLSLKYLLPVVESVFNEIFTAWGQVL